MTSVFKANGRESKFLGKLKTTSFMEQIEDDLNYLDKWKMNKFWVNEDDLNFFGKWKSTSILS